MPSAGVADGKGLGETVGAHRRDAGFVVVPRADDGRATLGLGHVHLRGDCRMMHGVLVWAEGTGLDAVQQAQAGQLVEAPSRSW